MRYEQRQVAAGRKTVWKQKIMTVKFGVYVTSRGGRCNVAENPAGETTSGPFFWRLG